MSPSHATPSEVNPTGAPLAEGATLAQGERQLGRLDALLADPTRRRRYLADAARREILATITREGGILDWRDLVIGQLDPAWLPVLRRTESDLDSVLVLTHAIAWLARFGARLAPGRCRAGAGYAGAGRARPAGSARRGGDRGPGGVARRGRARGFPGRSDRAGRAKRTRSEFDNRLLQVDTAGDAALGERAQPRRACRARHPSRAGSAGRCVRGDDRRHPGGGRLRRSRPRRPAGIPGRSRQSAAAAPADSVLSLDDALAQRLRSERGLAGARLARLAASSVLRQTCQLAGAGPFITPLLADRGAIAGTLSPSRRAAALAEGLGREVGRIRALDAIAADWARAVSDIRADSRIHAVVALLFEEPAITARRLQVRLGLSVRASHLAVAALTRRRVLKEVSGRRWFRVFVADALDPEGPAPLG